MAAVLLYVCSSFVVWAALWPISGAVQICPASCTCLGDYLACTKKGLLSVPSDLPDWVTILELQSNGISSIRPDDFKGLRKLKSLFLSKNDITFINGSMFDELESLHTLEITHNQLTEMPVFPSHLGIKELSLAHNMIHTVTHEALQALPHLEVLYLNHNQIMDLPVGAFPSPSHLTHLYLNNNKIMRLEPGCLDNLTSLQELRLQRNQMFELRKDLFHSLTSLRFLELSRNKISTILGLTFEGLKNLQVLKLKRNSIATLMDGAFYGLTRISNLQLDYNSISNITSRWLFGLCSLKHLSLTHNKIAHIQEDGWESCEQNLNSLDLTHNQLQAIYTRTFTKLTRLEKLLLDHNRLSRIDDGAFDGLRDLITLEMNDNAIAWSLEDMTGAFQGLRRLVTLGLKMNHIKSITNTAFNGLGSLQQLHLQDNNITTIQQHAFQPLVNLRQLQLNSTNLLCDCHLGWLAGWLKSYGFHNSVIAVCSYPQSLRGKNIFQIDPEDFKCNDLEISKPVILSSPQSQNAYKGQNLTLTCTGAVTGEGEPSIQWKKDKVVLSDSLMENTVHKEGDVHRYTSSLRLRNVQDNMAGLYQCIVSNKFGSSFSKKAKINVYVFPTFIKKPMDITVKAGQSAKLQCSASGQPMPVISWQKDGGDDFPAARERRVHVIPNDDHFFIASTRSADQGVYTCRAQNEAGNATANATVIILETPDFISPMEREKTARVGETAVLECMASGSPRPRLQWMKDHRPLDITPRHFFTAHNQLLIIVETNWDDDGLYTCEMSNTLGITRGNTRLSVVSADGQRKSSKSPKGLDDQSTTTGIIIIAVVCCVVGTSLVWVIIIYQTRKRHEMYTATPTDETMLPGEIPSGYSSDKEGSYTQAPISSITAFHYQDYQLKEMGYETSSLGRHPHNTTTTTATTNFNNNNNSSNSNSNGWTTLRPSAAIFPSDVDEDDSQGSEPLTSLLSPSQQELRHQAAPQRHHPHVHLHHHHLRPHHHQSLHHHYPSSEEESNPLLQNCVGPGLDGREMRGSDVGEYGGGGGVSSDSSHRSYDVRDVRAGNNVTDCGSDLSHRNYDVRGNAAVVDWGGGGSGGISSDSSHRGSPYYDCEGREEETTLSHYGLVGGSTGGVGDSSRGVGTLSTFHPGPTNHDRCSSGGIGGEGGGAASRSIALPLVCGETETTDSKNLTTSTSTPTPSTSHTATATTQTPCPNCRRCDETERLKQGLLDRGGGGCGRCANHHHHHHHRQFATDRGGGGGGGCGNSSDSNAHTHRPTAPHPPLVSVRASSFSSLPSAGARSLRPVVKPGVSCCPCRSVMVAPPCRNHGVSLGGGGGGGGAMMMMNRGAVQQQQQCHGYSSSSDGYGGESSSCDEATVTSTRPCNHHTCAHPVIDCGSQQHQQQNPHVNCSHPSSNSSSSSDSSNTTTSNNNTSNPTTTTRDSLCCPLCDSGTPHHHSPPPSSPPPTPPVV